MIMLETRVGAVVGLVYSIIGAAATWRSPLEFVGLPAPVVFMAFAGVAFGLILQPPKASRVAMFLLTLAYTFFSAVVTVLLGSIPHFDWMRDAGPAIAGLLGFFAQAAVPAARGRLQREITDRGANGSSGGNAP